MFNRNIYDRLLNTDTLGRELVILERASSTNDEIANRLDQPNLGNVVVVALTQDGGRGRFGRRWTSPPDVSLAFSLAWRVPDSLNTVSVVTIVAGVALAEAVCETTKADPALKYPNDLMLNGGKAGGILTELKSAGAEQNAIIGVGLNVNTRAEMFPEDIRERATSILLATGAEASGEAVLAVFLNRLEMWLDILTTDGPKQAVEAFRKLSPEYIGRPVTVTGAGETIKGIATGLDDNGGLLVRTGDGLVKTVISGEVIFDRAGKTS